MEENRKHFWQGNVGVAVTMKTNSKTGEEFPVFEPVRCYKVEDDDNMRYSHSFSRDEMTRLAGVVNEAIAYVDGSATQAA